MDKDNLRYHLINEGFEFDDDLMQDAEECDSYYAVEVGTNEMVKEAVKDMDIRQVLTAMTGVVPPQGWHRADGTRSGLLVLDKKWKKWANEMAGKLAAVGWNAIRYPGRTNRKWKVFCEVLIASRAGDFKNLSAAGTQWFNDYQYALSTVPEWACEYIPFQYNSNLYVWENIFVSPDEGLVFVQIPDWGVEDGAKHTIMATGKKYYVMKDAKYDVAVENAKEKQLRKGISYLMSQWTVRPQVRKWVSGYGYITQPGNMTKPMYNLARRFKGSNCFDLDGYPVVRFMCGGRENMQPKWMSADERLNYGGKIDREIMAYITQSFDPVDIDGIGYREKPMKLYVHKDGYIYYAVYTASSSPSAFSDAQYAVKYRTPSGDACDAVCEFGLTDKGVAAYDAKFGKPKK